VVPALSNVKVRQAINYAIDNKSILDKIMLGFGDTTHQIFGKASDAFDPDLDKAYSYDPDKAKDLLADAGYADGFTVTMPDPPGNATVDAVIGQELAAVGITVNWDKLPAGNSVAVLQTGKYPMFYFNTAQNSTWKQIQNSVAPTAPWNTSKSDDPKLDELIHAVQYATPGDDQAKAGRALNKWLVDNAWFAPMFTGVIILATDANTHVDVQPQNATSFTRDFTPAG
jgi:peptide/nickel transport system substrate-binding protein